MWAMIFVLTAGVKNWVVSGEYSFVVNSVLQSHKSALSTNRASAPLKRFDLHYRRAGMHKRLYINYQVYVLIFVVTNTK
jgi:hypothetical protein